MTPGQAAFEGYKTHVALADGPLGSRSNPRWEDLDHRGHAKWEAMGASMLAALGQQTAKPLEFNATINVNTSEAETSIDRLQAKIAAIAEQTARLVEATKGLA